MCQPEVLGGLWFVVWKTMFLVLVRLGFGSCTTWFWLWYDLFLVLVAIVWSSCNNCFKISNSSKLSLHI